VNAPRPSSTTLLPEGEGSNSLPSPSGRGGPADPASAELSGAGGGAEARFPQTAGYADDESARQGEGNTLPPKQIYESNKLAKRLRRLVGQAIGDYTMIRAGDRVMVCLSGGKDSYAMLDVLLNLRAHAPIDF
jgi:hypothetical protein